MARPNKIGLDYFPLDVNIDSDDKIELIEAEFGIKGFGIIIKLFCKIYKDKGYYYEWGDKERLLFAKRSGESGGLVDEIIKRSVKWGLFDEDVFNQFQILTSAAIQKRYLEAVNRRDEVEIINEICLLNINDYKNIVNVSINEDNAVINLQSKVKESKVKESKEKGRKNSRFSPPTIDQVQDYILEKNYKHVKAERFCNFYESKGWYVGKNKMKNWKSAVSGWENRAKTESNGKSNYQATNTRISGREEIANGNFEYSEFTEDY